MGLRDAILSAVSSAIDATGDIAESVTFVTKTQAGYDVSFGQNTAIETSYTVKAIVSVISAKISKDIISSGNTGELSLVFASKGLAFTPKTSDIIIRASERYTINDIDSDPVNASYTITIRKLG